MKAYELLAVLKTADPNAEVLVRDWEESDMYAVIKDVELKHKRVILVQSTEIKE